MINAQKIAGDSVRKIFEDLRDRRDLKQLFDKSEHNPSRICTEVQNEIHDKWVTIIVSALRKAGIDT